MYVSLKFSETINIQNKAICNLSFDDTIDPFLIYISKQYLTFAAINTDTNTKPINWKAKYCYNLKICKQTKESQ